MTAKVKLKMRRHSSVPSLGSIEFNKVTNKMKPGTIREISNSKLVDQSNSVLAKLLLISPISERGHKTGNFKLGESEERWRKTIKMFGRTKRVTKPWTSNLRKSNPDSPSKKYIDRIKKTLPQLDLKKWPLDTSRPDCSLASDIGVKRRL